MIDFFVGFDNLFGHIHSLVQSRHIRTEDSRLPFALRDFLGDLFELLFLNIHKDGLRSFPGKFKGDTLPDPLRSACHDRDLVLKNHLTSPIWPSL